MKAGTDVAWLIAPRATALARHRRESRRQRRRAFWRQWRRWIRTIWGRA